MEILKTATDWAKAEIGMMNLIYNINRCAQLKIKVSMG